MRHSAVRNCIDSESMKRSLRFCELGAEAGAGAAATAVTAVTTATGAATAAALPLPLADLLSAFEAFDACFPDSFTVDDGLALALLVCFGLAALLVRAPAGARTKLVS